MAHPMVDQIPRSTNLPRVLVVASWYPTPANPIHGIFIARQVRALSSRFDVAVIAPKVRTLRERLTGGWGVPAGVATEGGVPTVRPRVLALRYRDARGIAARCDTAVARAVAQLARSWGTPDLVHAHVVLPGGHAAVALAETLRVPVVLTEHSGPFSMHLRTSEERELVSATLRRLAGCVAVSPALAEEMRAVERIPIDVIGNVIDTSFFSLRAQSRKAGAGGTRFAFVGSLTVVKGADVLLMACARLIARGLSDWELRIVGDGPEADLLTRLSRAFGSRVTFLPTLPAEGVRSVMEWADFLVVPSRHETFGVVAAEALSVGIGVIASDVGGLPYVVQANGRLIPPGDPSALAAAMEDAVRGSLGVDRARGHASIVRRFGRDAFLNQITAVYRKAMAAGPTASAGMSRPLEPQP